jgi:hypothetical protein
LSGRFRADCLNAHWFLTLDDARSKMEDWRKYYNEVRVQITMACRARHREKVICSQQTGPFLARVFRV